MPLDFNVFTKIAFALGVAFITSFAMTPIVRVLAPKVGAMDVPKDARRVHDHPIPRLGGLAIFIGFVLSIVLFASSDEQMKGVLLGAAVIVAVGAVDDIIPLPAWLKLIFQIAAAGIVVAHGIRIEIITNPNLFSDTELLKLGYFAVPITIIWIVGITNSVNLIDGLDGLACGVSSIASLTMLVISVILGQWNVAIILAALLGACLGFLPFNFNPAKIFMGDTGALLLGYVLAVVSVTGFFKFYAVISFAVPLLALGFPIFDTVFAIVRRLLKGQNPMMPDRGHFHHRLMDMGLNQKQAVAILYTISAVMGFAAVFITIGGEMKAIMLVLVFCVVGIAGVTLIRKLAMHNYHVAKDNEEQGTDGGEEVPPQDETAESDAEGNI